MANWPFIFYLNMQSSDFYHKSDDYLQVDKMVCWWKDLEPIFLPADMVVWQIWGNAKGGTSTVQLTSCLDLSVLQI